MINNNCISCQSEGAGRRRGEGGGAGQKCSSVRRTKNTVMRMASDFTNAESPLRAGRSSFRSVSRAGRSPTASDGQRCSRRQARTPTQTHARCERSSAFLRLEIHDSKFDSTERSTRIDRNAPFAPLRAGARAFAGRQQKTLLIMNGISVAGSGRLIWNAKD